MDGQRDLGVKSTRLATAHGKDPEASISDRTTRRHDEIPTIGHPVDTSEGRIIMGHAREEPALNVDDVDFTNRR
jgi:hypothetical protein